MTNKNNLDNNKVVADMSNVGKRSLFLPHFDFAKKEDKEVVELNKEERKWYILGTLKAALTIASVYIIALGAFILLIVLAYKYLVK